MSAAFLATMLDDARRVEYGADVIDRGENEDLALQACAERVRALKKVTTENIIKIGKELIFAKSQLRHGQFGNWLEAGVMMSERTAERFMSATKWAEGKTDTVSVLDPTSIYLLSAPSAPKHVTSEVMTRIARGEAMPVENVRALIKVARSEQREAKGKELSAQKGRARAGADRGQMEDREQEERAAATEFAHLLRSRIDDIRGDLAGLLAATNGAALLEALKTELGASSATLPASSEDAPHVSAATMSDMLEIPPLLRRVSQPPADQPA